MRYDKMGHVNSTLNTQAKLMPCGRIICPLVENRANSVLTSGLNNTKKSIFENRKSVFGLQNVFPFVFFEIQFKILISIFSCVGVLLTTAVLLANCSLAYPPPRFYVAPELQNEFSTFIAEAKAHNRPLKVNNLVVQLGTTSADRVGNCDLRSYTPIVTISEQYWLNADIWAREMLLFHELGHCVLQLEHNDAINVDGEPVSLMVSYLSNSYYYEAHRETYLQQLFGHARLYK